MGKSRTHGRRPYRPLTVTVDASGRVNFRPVLVDPMSASLGTGDATEAGTRSVPARAFVTTLDQGVASVSNFAVGVVVARVSGVAGLGAFSLAYAAWISLPPCTGRSSQTQWQLPVTLATRLTRGPT